LDLKKKEKFEFSICFFYLFNEIFLNSKK